MKQKPPWLRSFLFRCLAVLTLSQFAAGDGLLLDKDFRPAITSTRNAVLFAVALQPDGKVLVAGDFALVNGIPRRSLARLQIDGSLDPGFDAGEGVTGLVFRLAVQPGSGDVVAAGQFGAVAGQPRTSLARLRPDGTLDAGFQPQISGPDGWFIGAMVLQPDGQIVIGGNFDHVNGEPRNGLARLSADGALDETFDPGAGLNGGTAYDLAVQDDGRLLVAGSFTQAGDVASPGIARMEPNGAVDLTFMGTLSAGQNPAAVYAMALQPDQEIVVAGAFDTVDSELRPGIARLQADGRLDAGFDPGAGIEGDETAVHDLVILPGGEVAITGSFDAVSETQRNGLAVLGTNGAVNAGFDPGPGLAPVGSALGNMLAVQPDGKLIAVGQFTQAGGIARHCLARFLTDGSVDPTFSTTNSFLECGGEVRAVAALPGGRLLVGGDFDRVNGEWHNGLVQLAPDGELDPGFDAGLTNGAAIDAIVVQPDGKPVIGGAFDRVGVTTRSNLARLNLDGSIDATFGDAQPDAPVHALALLPDGSVLAGGEFEIVSGTRRFGLVRVSTNGEVDLGFDARFEMPLDQPTIRALAVEPDGGIVAGGYFDQVDGELRQNLARLNADGTLDADFAAGLDLSGSPPVVTSVVLRPDSKLYVGGSFTRVAGQSQPGVLRLLADGSLDPTFMPGDNLGGAEEPAVRSLANLPGGGLAIGGEFFSFAHEPVGNFQVLATDGSSGPAANWPPGADSTVSVVCPVAPDWLVVGGTFTRFAGETRLGLARIKVEPPAPVYRVVIVREAGEVTIHWEGGGRLLEADCATGPWHEVVGATSPYQTLVTGELHFYRCVK